MSDPQQETTRLGPLPTPDPLTDELLGGDWAWDEAGATEDVWEPPPPRDEALQELIDEVCAVLTSRVPVRRSSRFAEVACAAAPALPRPRAALARASVSASTAPSWADTLLASLPPVPPRRAQSVAAQLRRRVEARRASTSRDGLAFRLAVGDDR